MTEMISQRVNSIKSPRKRRRNDHPVCILTQILSGEDILMEAHECIPADEKGYLLMYIFIFYFCFENASRMKKIVLKGINCKCS